MQCNSFTDGVIKLLIKGDNLKVMQSLLPKFKNKIKCIFIDPPYNTKQTFTHYKDKMESKDWLEFMRSRLELMHQLLADDGSIWVTINDNECHYLKILMDEIFGRKNFVANCIWEKKYAPQNVAKSFSPNHDHILTFAKNKKIWRPYLLPRTKEMDARYKNLDNDPRGRWHRMAFTTPSYNVKNDYLITLPSGRTVKPSKTRSWLYSQEKYQELLKDNKIWFGFKGDAIPHLKRFLSEVKQGISPMTIWKYTEVGHTQDAKQEILKLNTSEIFDTPKPEKLIKRILDLATKENDLVLDAFLGSGTTTVVAHKMNRQYIGIENSKSFENICIPRMHKSNATPEILNNQDK